MAHASNDTPPQPLSTTIREARKAIGLSPEGLAFKAGVSLKTVERIETGTVVPRRATLKVVADVLELDLSAYGVNGKAA